ncbi:MAG: zinc ribbon domain-containing protein [Planctomycetaceae bacterium]|nr:zinc ribbon domain-containing protein [Planctomycetaceae bacterium]
MVLSDDFNDPLDDREYPDPDETEDDFDVVPCPHCGQDVFEDSVQCPYCSQYITSTTNPWSGRPTWWIVLGIAGVVLTVLAILFS